MDFLYRLAGVAAGVNSALGRMSINLIPLNFALILGLGALTALFGGIALDGLRSRKEPVAVSIEALAGPTYHDDYVSIKGIAIPELLMQYGKLDKNGNLKEVTHEWTPVLDQATGEMIFVQFPVGKYKSDEKPSPVELTGLVKTIHNALKAEMEKEKAKTPGLKLNLEHTVHAGLHPPEPFSAIVLSTGGAAGTVLMALAVLMGNVVFREAPGDRAHPAAGSNIDLRATGQYLLEEQKTRKKFVEVPAGISRLENGDWVVYSNIDASSRFMGFTTSKLAGMWVIPLKAGTIARPARGYVYFGLNRRPAIRLDFTDSLSGNSARAFISCKTNEERELVLQTLGIPAAS